MNHVYTMLGLKRIIYVFKLTCKNFVIILPQETRDIAEKKTKLMTELEREKEKLERDINQLTTNKVWHFSTHTLELKGSEPE